MYRYGVKPVQIWGETCTDMGLLKNKKLLNHVQIWGSSALNRGYDAHHRSPRHDFPSVRFKPPPSVVYLRSADKYRRLPLDRHKDETASRKGLSFITAAPPCPDALDISRAYTACRIDAVSSIASCGSPDCADIASSGLLSFPCWIERPI